MLQNIIKSDKNVDIINESTFEQIREPKSKIFLLLNYQNNNVFILCTVYNFLRLTKYNHETINFPIELTAINIPQKNCYIPPDA